MPSLLLALLLISASPDETVRVASYNVENYLIANRRVEGRWLPDYPKPENEKQALRDLIREVRPDILALQEMGSPPFLSELQNDLRAEGLDYPHAYVLQGPDDTRHLALLSRLEPLAIDGHDSITFRYLGETETVKRGLLEVTFQTGGTTWTLYNLHLKSRWTTREDDPQSLTRRTSEAQAIRDLIRERHPPGEPDTRYLIVGDFNDHIDSAPLRRFLRVGQTPLTEIIPTTDSRGETWTFHFRRRDLYERVDFLLASPALAPSVVPGSGTIVDTLPQSTTASDHRMIYVDLDFSRL